MIEGHQAMFEIIVPRILNDTAILSYLVLSPADNNSFNKHKTLFCIIS